MVSSSRTGTKPSTVFPEPPPSAAPPPPPDRQLSWACILMLIFSVGLIAIALPFCEFSFDIADPDFRVQSVSVSLYNKNATNGYPNSQTRAEWNITFTVENGNSLNVVRLRDPINVSIQCMSSHPTAGTVFLFPPFHHGRPNLILEWWSSDYSASINTSLPLPNATNVELPFHVNFQTFMKYSNGLRSGRKFVNATCRNLKIEFLSNGTFGPMLAEPYQYCDM